MNITIGKSSIKKIRQYIFVLLINALAVNLSACSSQSRYSSNENDNSSTVFTVFGGLGGAIYGFYELRNYIKKQNSKKASNNANLGDTTSNTNIDNSTSTSNSNSNNNNTSNNNSVVGNGNTIVNGNNNIINGNSRTSTTRSIDAYSNGACGTKFSSIYSSYYAGSLIYSCDSLFVNGSDLVDPSKVSLYLFDNSSIVFYQGKSIIKSEIYIICSGYSNINWNKAPLVSTACNNGVNLVGLSGSLTFTGNIKVGDSKDSVENKLNIVNGLVEFLGEFNNQGKTTLTIMQEGVLKFYMAPSDSFGKLDLVNNGTFTLLNSNSGHPAIFQVINYSGNGNIMVEPYRGSDNNYYTPYINVTGSINSTEIKFYLLPLSGGIVWKAGKYKLLLMQIPYNSLSSIQFSTLPTITNQYAMGSMSLVKEVGVCSIKSSVTSCSSDKIYIEINPKDNIAGLSESPERAAGLNLIDAAKNVGGLKSQKIADIVAMGAEQANSQLGMIFGQAQLVPIERLKAGLHQVSGAGLVAGIIRQGQILSDTTRILQTRMTALSQYSDLSSIGKTNFLQNLHATPSEIQENLSNQMLLNSSIHFGRTGTWAFSNNNNIFENTGPISITNNLQTIAFGKDLRVNPDLILGTSTQTIMHKLNMGGEIPFNANSQSILVSAYGIWKPNFNHNQNGVNSGIGISSQLSFGSGHSENDRQVNLATSARMKSDSYFIAFSSLQTIFYELGRKNQSVQPFVNFGLTKIIQSAYQEHALNPSSEWAALELPTTSHSTVFTELGINFRHEISMGENFTIQSKNFSPFLGVIIPHLSLSMQFYDKHYSDQQFQVNLLHQSDIALKASNPIPSSHYVGHVESGFDLHMPKSGLFMSLMQSSIFAGANSRHKIMLATKLSY